MSLAAWSEAEGVSLHQADALPDSAPLRRALADGVARGYDGPLPPRPTGATLLLVREESETAGVLVLTPGPGKSAATVLAVAVAPERRGRAVGLRAVLAAERRLGREGSQAVYASVPRRNGRGVYFWLRAGYRPLLEPPEGGAPCAEGAPEAAPEGCGWFYRRLDRPERGRR